MQNSPQTDLARPPPLNTETSSFPASHSAVQFWRGIIRVVHLSCACGSGQRSLMRFSLAPAFARSSQACRSGRCCFATFCPPPRHHAAKVAHASPLFVAPFHSAPHIGFSLATLAQIPQHLWRHRSPPPKPPFVHPTKKALIYLLE